MVGWRGFCALAAAAGIWSAGFLAGFSPDLSSWKPACPVAGVADPTFAGILSTNSRVLLGCFMGLATSGISAAGTLFLNGIYCGLQWQGTAGEIGKVRLLTLLLPHGVFELTGFVLAGAVGLGGIPLAGRLLGKSRPVPIPALAHALNAALAIALVSLGAAVESFQLGRMP